MEIVLVVSYWMLPIATFKDISILLLYVQLFQENEKAVNGDVACFEFKIFEHKCYIRWQGVPWLRNRGNYVGVMKAKVIS
jgi:hypothetical protein